MSYKIEQEFFKIKKYFKLKNLNLLFNKNHYCFDDKNCSAIFETNNVESYMILRNRRFSKEQLKSMLHEACHAIQHVEGRIEIPTHHTRRLYALEIEAEMFASVYYNKLFSKKYGKYDHFVLANYQAYCLFFKNKNEDINIKNITSNELQQFVGGLDSKFSRHILKLAKSL